MTAGELMLALRRATEERTLDLFPLEKLPLGDRARKEGSWNGRTITLETEIYAGSSKLARLHVARMRTADDAASSLTVLAIPRCDTGAPVLGVDVVSFGGASCTAILDLRPSGRPLQDVTAQSLMRARGQLLAVGEPRELVADVLSPFSPLVTFCLVPEAARAALQTALRVYAAAFATELTESRSVDADATREARESQLELLSRLAGIKKQMRVLGKLFGEAWMVSYFDEVFLSPASVV